MLHGFCSAKLMLRICLVAVAQQVLSRREVKVQGKFVNVQPAEIYESHKAEEPDPHSKTIQVTNISSDTDEEMLELVFENRRYGGGAIKELKFDRLKGFALITYETSEGNSYYFTVIVIRLCHAYLARGSAKMAQHFFVAGSFKTNTNCF